MTLIINATNLLNNFLTTKETKMINDTLTVRLIAEKSIKPPFQLDNLSAVALEKTCKLLDGKHIYGEYKQPNALDYDGAGGLEFNDRYQKVHMTRVSHQLSNFRIVDGWLVGDIKFIGELGEKLSQLITADYVSFYSRGFLVREVSLSNGMKIAKIKDSAEKQCPEKTKESDYLDVITFDADTKIGNVPTIVTK